MQSGGAAASGRRRRRSPLPPVSRQVERPDGSNALVLLPARFHKTLWIKRGGYLVVTAPPGVGPGAGAAGEVVAVLYRADVRALRAMPGVWPPEFEDAAGDGGPRPAPERASGSASGSEDSGLPPLAANPNRRRPTYETSSSEDEAEAEGGGGEGEGGA